MKKLIDFLNNNGFDNDIIVKVLNANKFYKTKKLNWHEARELHNNLDMDFIKILYEQYKIPIYKIAMLHGISDVSLRDKMILFGFDLKGHCVGKNSQNKYFSDINSYDKAYFLGLFAADGSIVNETMSIELRDYDKYILELFVKKANLNTILIKDCRDDNSRYVLRFHSKNMVNDLNKNYIYPRKSYNNTLQIPNIDKKYIRHFIRGYFDGNGIANKKGYVGFCGSKTIISQIHNILVNELEISNNKITYNKSNHIYYIQWGKKEDTKKIFNYFYKNISDCYLKRKKEKIHKRLTGQL